MAIINIIIGVLAGFVVLMLAMRPDGMARKVLCIFVAGVAFGRVTVGITYLLCKGDMAMFTLANYASNVALTIGIVAVLYYLVKNDD